MHVSRSLVRLPLAFAASLVLLSGCGGISSPSSNTNESFGGVVFPATGSTEPFQIHNFTVGRNGEMSARVTALNPSAALIGLAFGNSVNGTCDGGVNSTNSAGLNRDVMVTPLYQRGNYCLMVFAGINTTGPTSYTVQVNHP